MCIRDRYTVQCTLYTEVYICALHNTLYTVYSVHCTVHSVHCTVRNVDCVPCFLTDYETFWNIVGLLVRNMSRLGSMTLDNFRMTE